MKLLFLDAYFEPESTAYTHLECDLLEKLFGLGHKVQIICPTPTRGVSEETRTKYKKILQESRFDGGIMITRFSAPQEGKNPLGRALRYVWCNLRSGYLAGKDHGIDVIFCNSTPPTQGMLCAKVAKKLSKKYGKKVPFVFNLQDIFPDSLVNANMTHEGSLIWKLGRKIEDYTYRNADKIIVISQGFKENIMAKGVPEDKIVVIPNWIDTESVQPIDRKDNVLFDRYQLDRDKFYVCYSGNVGHSQNLPLLLDTAQALQDSLPEVRFVIVGEGAAKQELQKAVAERKLENMILLPFQPYEEISHVFSLGDAGLIISKPGIGGSSVPSKTWSIMAAQRPVLASFDEDSELCAMVKETGCGVTAPAGDCQALVKAVERLYHDREERAHMGEIGRKYVQENLNKEKCTGMYVDTLRKAQK